MKKKTKRKEYFYRREFINRKGYHTSAHILMDISVENKNWWDVVFDIGDCSRIVSLSLGIDDKKERTNSLYKIKKLKESIIGFEKALIKASKDAEKQEIEDKKERAEEIRRRQKGENEKKKDED